MTNDALNAMGSSPDGVDLWRRVLDSLTAEVAVMDSSGKIIAVNKAWKRFAEDNGGPVESTGVGANYLSACQCDQSEDGRLAARARDGIRDILAGRSEVFQLEYPCHSASERRWFLLHASALNYDHRYVVTTHLSITERKLTEQKLVVAERLAAIGEAMQGLSHEGRNALQRAQACIDLLRFHISDEPEAVDLLSRIESAQHHLLALYEEVKSYAAPITLQYQTCDLGQLVGEAYAACAPPAAQVEFSNHTDGIDLFADVDAGAVRQVFQLSLDNALAAGGDPAIVDVSYLVQQLDRVPAITVVISDAGPGIPPDERQRVFEPFYTTKTRGTGLGLAVCRRIISAHGGQISFGAARRGGASLYITLPRQRPPTHHHGRHGGSFP